MRHGGRVCDDDIGNEELLGVLDGGGGDGVFAQAVAGLDAAAPAAIHDLRHLLPTLANITGLDALSVGQQARVADHVGHEGLGVTADAEELDALLLDKVLENGVGADADPVAVGAGEDLGNGDKGLDVAAGADNVDGDVEARDGGRVDAGGGRRGGTADGVLAGALHLQIVVPVGEGMLVRVEANLEAAVVGDGAGRAILENELAGLS